MWRYVLSGDGWSLWRPRSEGCRLRTEGGDLEIDSVDLWGRRYDDCVSWGEVCMSGRFVSTEERIVSVGYRCGVVSLG